MIGLIKTNILNNNFPIRCPKDGCDRNISEFDIKSLLSEELFQKYQDHTLKSYAEVHGDSMYYLFNAALGAQHLLVDICSSMKRMMDHISGVLNAIKHTVLTVEQIGMNSKLVRSTPSLLLSAKRTINLWTMWKGKNISNALNASFGFQKIMVVITWPVNVNFNFATNVVEFIKDVNVLKKTK